MGVRNVSTFISYILGKKTLLSCARLILRKPRLRFPAAAEGFVEGDEVLGDGFFALRELVFGLIERALGVEDIEEISEALGVKFVSQLDPPPVGLRFVLQRTVANLLLGISDEGVFHILQ